MSGYIGVLPVPQTTQTRESFTATNGQTSFGTSGYQIDHLDVYLNGVKLAAADFTATNGSDIVLATGAALNDILEMVAFETFTIANQSFTGTTTVDTLVVTNTVDGRDVSVDGAKLDTIPIVSTSSTPSFTAKGDGSSQDGYIQLNCSQNSHGIKLKAPPHSANASYTLTFPNDDGNANQFLKTDGSGVLSWATDSTTDSTKLPLAGGAMTGAITTNSTFDGVDVATRDAVLTSTTTTAGAALPKAGGALTGAVTTNSTFDGRDVAADGVTADAALPKAGGAMTGAITTNSTFDGVDIATRDAILTSTTTTANAALPKAGGAMTGAITTNSTFDGRDVAADGVLATNALPKSGGTMTGALNITNANNLQVKDRGSVLLYNTNDDNYARIRNTTASGNELQFSTNALAMTINTSGKVGIGIAAPAQNLAVKVGSDIIVGVWGDNSAGYGAIQSANVANNAYKQLRFDASSYHFAQGNVGIGTSAPDVPFVVQSNSGGSSVKILGRSSDSISGVVFANAANNASNYIQSNSSYIRARADGGFHFRKGGTPTVSDAGAFTVEGLNVGIGTAAPTVPFAVSANPGAAATPVAWLHNSGNVSGYDGVVISSVNDGSDAEVLHVRANNSTYANGTSLMLVRGDGAVTMPLQPAFSAIPASNQNNIALNQQVAIAFGTERFDVGGNFASSTFTAPVTGKYSLHVHLRLQNIDSAAAYYILRISTSNEGYQSLFSSNQFNADLQYWPIAMNCLADMDEDDTASITLYQSGGTAQTDISAESYFNGILVA